MEHDYPAETANGSVQAGYAAQRQLAGRAAYGASVSQPVLTKDMPLSMAIKDATSNHLQAATRTFNTLSELRDRMIGAPPENPMGTDGRNAEPSSFSDAIRGANSELGQRLAMLEALAQELANRL